MVEVKRFSGVLNCDDFEEDVLPSQHISARNISFAGGSNGLTAMNIPGNFLVANSNLPAETNESCGVFFDSVKRRILWFNHNSNGNHGLYQLSVQTGQVTQIFRCGVHSAGDILRLNLDYPIHSMAIVYRTDGDGDLLYWTDGNTVDLNRPRYLNLDTVSTLAPFTESMINAAKRSPQSPPTFPTVANTNGVFGYFSDATVNYNSVKNKLFRFAYRWVYKNGEKSTFSPISIVPLPLVTDPNLQVDATLNNYIKVIVYSPNEADYEDIEVFGQESTGTTWGDFFLIETLNRTQYNIAVNSSFTYSFYNDGSYIFVDPQESDLYFDWLPDYANTLELLNGNVLIYGGTTDGYDNLTRAQVDVSITSSLVSMEMFTPPTALINSAPSFRWGSVQKFGLVYFDSRGKTNGVISFTGDPVDTTDFSVTTPNYPGQTLNVISTIPKISASINHIPPSWAVSYQWVRVDQTPKFLQWVTKDYQTDNQHLYLCIENLVQMNAKNGFLPSYGFTVGDRVKIMARLNGDNDTTVYSVQQDYPILGIVQRMMNTPAALGAYLKVPKPSSFPTPAYSGSMLIEMFTPIEKVPDKQQLYFEWGEKYDIYTLLGVNYHRGQTQDQTASQPALFGWTEGDVYIKTRAFYIAVPIENNVFYTYLDMMDANWNDYVPTASNANGRVWAVNENAKVEYNGVISRWGGAYQPGTNINSLNRFRPNDFDEADRAKGDIRRYKARDRILRVFQDRGVGQYGVYQRFIRNNEGVPELVTTNEIITTNNIQYYQGQFGLGGYPTNLCSSEIADYFVDVITGREIRLAADGMTDLGLLYKGQFTLSNLVTPYNKVLRRSNGKIAKVMKFWDSFENQAHTVLQAGRDVSAGAGAALVFTFNESISNVIWGLAFDGVARAGDVVKVIYTDLSGTTTFNYVCSEGQLPTSIRDGLITLINVSVSVVATPVTHGGFFGLNITYNSIISQAPVSVVATLSYSGVVTTDCNYSFNERRNAFCSFYDYFPEWAISANDIIYSLKNGQIYKHDGQDYYCEFYGTRYGCHITVVFNQNLLEKKTWRSITEIASDTWSAPEIWTNTKSYGEQRQQTSLVAAEFVKLENNPSASIKRDANSSGGKINGQFVKGNWVAIKFQKQNAQSLVTLSELSLSYIDSPKTNR